MRRLFILRGLEVLDRTLDRGGTHTDVRTIVDRDGKGWCVEVCDVGCGSAAPIDPRSVLAMAAGPDVIR